MAVHDRQGERRLRRRTREDHHGTGRQTGAGRVRGATVIDLPWAISTLAESVGDLVAAGLDVLLTIGQRFVDALGNIRDIATQVGDHSKLPGGRWPEAVKG
ncbi:hypothetical protein ACLQ28_33700 [Micromonospora sp. DT201]|uniref:hypothetical protein n=1 Tax=Micromonospora sp. DT201 TaxID=3393442 RepID=UPI003CE8FE52